MTRGWAPQTCYTLWRNTVSINKDLIIFPVIFCINEARSFRDALSQGFPNIISKPHSSFADFENFYSLLHQLNLTKQTDFFHYLIGEKMLLRKTVQVKLIRKQRWRNHFESGGTLSLSGFFTYSA